MAVKTERESDDVAAAACDSHVMGVYPTHAGSPAAGRLEERRVAGRPIRDAG